MLAIYVWQDAWYQLSCENESIRISLCVNSARNKYYPLLKKKGTNQQNPTPLLKKALVWNECKGKVICKFYPVRELSPHLFCLQIWSNNDYFSHPWVSDLLMKCAREWNNIQLFYSWIQLLYSYSIIILSFIVWWSFINVLLMIQLRLNFLFWTHE